MLDKGYIRIPRKLFQSPEWKEKRVYSRFEAILSLYEQAAYTSGRFINLKGYAVSLERGQLVTTIRLLADIWGWSKSKVSRFLCELRDNSRDTFRINIETINGTSATLVTICNYDGNAAEVILSGTNGESIIGTAFETNFGTSIYKESKDIEIQYEKENTHTLIESFIKSCARVHKERNTTHALFNELLKRGCFGQEGDCYKMGLGMLLIGNLWSRFVTLQKKMEFPMTLSQANDICSKFDFKDIMRVLERMANTVGIEKQRKSVYHTLKQWLLSDFEVKEKLKQNRKHIYPSTL